MIITNKEIIEYAKEVGYNMEIFNDYLEYQAKSEDKYNGKWTVEAYAAASKFEGKTVIVGSRSFQEWFGNWMGFGGASYIPDYCFYERYCAYRDLYPFNIVEETEKDINTQKTLN